MANRVYTDNVPTPVSIQDIPHGGLFMYNNPVSSANVYMKISGVDNPAVQLRTGQVFDIKNAAQLLPINKVTIVSD